VLLFACVEYLSVSWNFSHSGGYRAPPVKKALGPAAGYTGATPGPLRWKLDQQGSFEETELQTIEPKQLSEESTANIGSIETPITDTWPSVIVPIQFYERLSVPHIVMEPNSVTSSGNSSIPTTVATTGEASPNFPSSV
jgi:hypothetical protein